MNITSAESGTRLLDALSVQLELLGAHYELVVVGGSALLALGLIARPTQDVDVVALRDQERLAPITPFPPSLETARDRVARDFRLPTSWLNDGPAALLDFGLPEGFLERAERRDYGPARSHDPSAGYLQQLTLALAAIGVTGATLTS